MQKPGTSLAGLNLTQIFELQPIQSLLIKFWYLGLTSECLIAKQDYAIFKTIKKSITFANCFTFQMPLKTYINFIEKILATLQQLQPKRTFDILLSHLRNNKVTSISFQLFGVSLLQLFGRLLQVLDSQSLSNLLRRVYISLTIIHKNGTSMIRANNQQISKIEFEDFIPSFDTLVKAERQKPGKKSPKKQMSSLSMDEKQLQNPEMNITTLKGRLQSQRSYNLDLRNQEPGQYPVGEKMKKKEKANISCFQMGGFEIVDYSESINQLHKKLLTKIILNK